MALEVGTFIGKYQVRRKLAEGGMAEIYLCSASGPEGFQKDVVIKRIRNHLGSDPEFVAMFVTEARVASRLNHPNLVHIFDFARHDGSYFLAMEYVAGHSLLEVRRRAKERCQAVPIVLAAHVAAEIARGLAHAHRLVDEAGAPVGLVHRDVTPHNILLSWNGEVKLTDFGIAKAGPHSTLPGILKGKLGYMSPEQARGEAIDARTDIFALGIVLWELLTGGRLFDADTDLAVLRAVQEMVIVPPARVNPEVPAALDAWVMKALQRDPALRPQTAKELELGLAEFLLTHARAVNDRNVGEFLRHLYEGERPDSDIARLPPPPPLLPTDLPVSPAGEFGLPDEDPVRPTEVLVRGGETTPKPTSVEALPGTFILPHRPRPPEDEKGDDGHDDKTDDNDKNAAPPPPRKEVREPWYAGTVASVRTVFSGLVSHFTLVLAVGLAARAAPWVIERVSAFPAKFGIGVQLPDAGQVLTKSVEPIEAKPFRGPRDAGTELRPVAQRKGTIEFQISPWANVYIGQSRKHIEVSHSARIDLPEGRYLIRMENPALKWSQSRFVAVRADREVLVKHDIPDQP